MSDIYIVASIIMSLVIVKWSSVGILNVLIVVYNVVYAAILLLLGGIKKRRLVFIGHYFVCGQIRVIFKIQNLKTVCCFFSNNLLVYS